ncbi:MAG: helix-turn-helix transcriptional regulator [Chloroflexota bacterium]|nr:hypothetical protein [Chloroflexota bacterium]MDE3103154.1 helix-turn-helix transcriptional regulator [Chloroflexota bacterium]
MVASGALLSPEYRTLVVFDPVGDAFRHVRELGLEASVWRVGKMDGFDALGTADLALYVWDGEPDWTKPSLIAVRTPTIAMLSSYTASAALEALRCGLWGCIPTTLTPAALRRALAGALAGQPAFSREVLGTWLRARSLHVADPRLTARQREIIALITEGATDKKIAASLGISVATVEKHVGHILDRLRVPNRAAAVAVAAAGACSVAGRIALLHRY